MAGTINISRDLWDDPAFRDEEFSQREAWIWLIAEASWRPRHKPIGIKSVWTERGQVAVSNRFLAKAWKWSEPRVRRYLNMLENRRMITRVTDAGVTVITICKYDEYQNAPRVGDAGVTQQPTQERRTADANDNKGEIRDIDGDDDACAREPDDDQPDELPDPPPKSETEIRRERILIAMGHDPSGQTADGRIIGKIADMRRATAWREDLGLTLDEILEVIREVVARKGGEPPYGFSYFDKPMAQYAGQKNAPKLTPIEGGKSDVSAATRRSGSGSTSSQARAIQGQVAGFARALDQFQNGSGGGEGDDR